MSNMRKVNNTLVNGSFTKEEDDFIKDNLMKMTVPEIAKQLNRSYKSVANRRARLGLSNKRISKVVNTSDRSSVLYNMSENEKRNFLLDELHRSSTYKQTKEVLTNKELQYYEEKYVDFMMDPTIETMTSMEKDALHQMSMSQIRIFRYMEEERQSRIDYDNFAKRNGNGDPPRIISRSREIKECEEIVQKCQEGLKVQRKQRLDNKSDQAVTFSAIIKELKDPNTRREAGYEAVMLKFIAEQSYNNLLRKNIKSGSDLTFNIGANFKNGTKPSGVGEGDFF